MKKNEKFIIENHGSSYYWPQESITNGLRKILIFTENKKKNGIPNGSVFVYEKDTPYYPEILGPDVGCGITAFITDAFFSGKEKSDANMRMEIIKAVNELKIHIGQGNHFIDFTVGHSFLTEKGIKSAMVFLHSDFNNENILPSSYEAAKNLENRAKDKRIEYLEKLTKLIGVSGNYYQDWTHNSIEFEDDFLVYRKGAIDLRKTQGIGALALNPLDGILLYAGNFSDYMFSVQHGLGRKGSRGELFGKLEKMSYGIARAYYLNYKNGGQYVRDLEKTAEQAFNNRDEFRNKYYLEYSLIGVCIPELVVTTKKA
jgi:hypothetical protein